MLARNHVLRSSCVLRRAHYHQPQLGLHLNRSRRTYSTLDLLKDGFLDLATALPIPPSWPAYSTTIILCTVVTRLALTVPFSVWSKRRQWRAEEQVVPRLKSEGPAIAESILKDMQREKVRGTKEELHGIHSSRMKAAVATRRKELFAEHRCQPMFTMAIPPLAQLPVFVGCSILLAHVSQHPTPLDSESFLTLSTLVHPDSTVALPIALGFITLANVESSTWFMTDQQRERAINVQKWKEHKIAKGETVIEPQKIIKSALRLVSIGRILIATMVPGSVVLYWVTSATFGLVQTWIFDYWELRRKKRLAAAAPVLTPPPAPSPLSPASSGGVGKRRKK